jgi:hypothetical protein
MDNSNKAGKSHYASHKTPSNRVPGKQVASGEVVKHALRFGRGKSRRVAPAGLSLKAQVRAILKKLPANDSELELQAAAERWLANKRVNTSANQLCVGRTRGRVKRTRGKSDNAAKNLSGK